jgi:hypothetical protein
MSQVRDERRGDGNGAVRLLVVLQERNDGAREGDAGRIQGMHEIWLGVRARAVPDIRTPGLKIRECARA